MELGKVIHVFVDDDPQIVALVVRRHVGGGEAFCHDAESDTGEGNAAQEENYRRCPSKKTMAARGF